MAGQGKAVAELLQAIRARPGYADAHCNIGNAFLLLEQYNKAQTAFRQTLALSPGNGGALLGLARLFREQDRFEEARAAVEQALARDPEKAEAHSLSGDLLVKTEDYEQAEAAYREAMELNAELLSAHLGRGQLFLELGKLEVAQAAFQRAMEIDPKEVAPHVHMAQARKLRVGDACLERLEAEAAKIDTMPATKAMSLHFALGKAYDDLKEYDLAFPHFLEGCRLKRARIQYDADNFDQACRNIRDFFTSDTLASLRGGGDPSDLPIFVLGMPRSGTTLVETIIASHPDVHGAGELRDLLALANQPRENQQSPGYPLSLHGITRVDLTRMGQRYVAGLRARSATARHITDKMPANFLALGLIHLMLPNAKIIHVQRNAADICLSGFTKLFNNSLYHSYDLSEMGR